MFDQFSVETEKFSAHYDINTCLLNVAYHGILSPAMTTEFYKWLGSMMRDYPEHVMKARGSIYDFHDVTEFENSNLTTASRQSQQLNMRTDLKNHPVALVVKNKLQEQILRLAMKITPHDERIRIVWSMEEATNYINDFHRQLHKGESQPETDTLAE